MLKQKFLFPNNLLLDFFSRQQKEEEEKMQQEMKKMLLLDPLLVFLSHDIFSPLPPTILTLSMLFPVLICFSCSREENTSSFSASWQFLTKSHKNVLYSCLAFHCIPWIWWEWWSSADSRSSQFNYHFSFKESFHQKPPLLVSLAEKKIKNEHLLRSPFCSLLFYCYLEGMLWTSDRCLIPLVTSQVTSCDGCQHRFKNSRHASHH